MKAIIIVLLLISSLQQALSGCVTPNQYTGNVSVTASHLECQAWSSQSPHAHTYTVDSLFPDGSVTAAANYCRDPDNSGFVWCYTTNPTSPRVYCNVNLCTDDCLSSNNYVGTVSVTVNGEQCAAWSSMVDSQFDSYFPDGSVTAAANYCRDPDNTGFPWCFTTDRNILWEGCSVDLCDPCNSNPCKNSGVCKSSGSTFTCQCAVGFSGASCETIVPDPCDARPCANGGVCTRNGNTDFVCTCAGGFTGPNCQSVDCLNDERDCSTLTFYGRFAKCDDCTKSVVCRAKKQWVRSCNAAKRPYYDRYAKRCTKSNAVCPGT